MADLSYDVSVNTTQAEASLTKLQKTVGGLNDSFIRLKTTLASISLGAVISQAIQYADAISDLSDASEIAIANLIGFSKAVEANGGSADGAQKAILRLVNSIGEAADGSASMQQAFRDVGVTIEDLRNTSNEGILTKTIEGLDKMENSAKRSILVTQLLGKEFRNVATGQLGAAYAEATAKSAQYADAIKKGADAQQNIDKTLGEFKIGVLEAIKPFTELISKVNIGVENFQKFVQALLAVGSALLLVSAAGRVWNVLKLVAVALAEIWSSAKAAAFAFGGFINMAGAVISDLMALSTMSARWTGIKIVMEGIANVLSTALGPAFTALKAVAMPVLAGIAGYWGWIQDSTSAAIDKLREYASALTFGMISAPQGGGAGRGNGQAEMDQRKKDAEEAAKKEAALREVLDQQAKTRSKIALDYEQQLDNMAIGLSRQTEAIWNESRLVELSKLQNVLSEDEVQIYKAQNQASVERLAAIKKIDQEQERLRQQLKFAKDEEKDGILTQIAYNEKLKTKTKEYYDVHDSSLRDVITYQQNINKLVEARKQDEENIIKAIEGQISRQQALGDILRQANDQRNQAIQATPASQLVGLTTIQKQIVDIQDKARLAAQEAARAFATNFEDSGDGLTPERAQELADGLDQIAAAYKRVADAQIDVAKQNNETARSFSTGWSDAFAKYAEDAQNSAEHAKTYFDAFTKGFEDAVVALVTNGKFSFKDFANSIIADFARIEARKALTNFMGGQGSGGSVIGSLFSWGKSLFGFANGGMMQAGVPAIVGERGPELFTPSTAGRITSNANAFARNEPTVVHTTVNYAIQAVDASSFRSLVARDPSFIYAVTEAGRRSQPTRRSA